METKENKRMLALACTVADMKTENMYLAQRVQELVDEYNNVAHQLNDKKWSKEEAQSKQTLDELQQMREHCDKLERENKELKRFKIHVGGFLLDKDFYMKKGIPCKYYKGKISVGSTTCLGCLSCLDSLGVNGVICEKRLDEEIGISPDDE